MDITQEQYDALVKSKQELEKKLRDTVQRANSIIKEAESQVSDARGFAEKLKTHRPDLYAKMLSGGSLEDVSEDLDLDNKETSTIRAELEDLKTMLKDSFNSLVLENNKMKNQLAREKLVRDRAPDLDKYWDKIVDKAKNNPNLLNDPDYIEMAYDHLAREDMKKRWLDEHEKAKKEKELAIAENWSPDVTGLGDLDLDEEKLQDMEPEELGERLFAEIEPAIKSFRRVERETEPQEGDSD